MGNSYGLPDYNFQSQFITLPDGNLHYIDEGTGPTLLMVHGNPTWSFLYRHLINSLKGNYRCIAIDHLGMGLSDKPSTGDYSVAAHTRRLGEAIEALSLGQLTLIVQDWGGPTGLGWAAENKHLVKRLVLLNTFAFPPTAKELPLLSKQSIALGVLASLRMPIIGEFLIQGLNGFVKTAMPLGMYKSKSRSASTLNGYAHPYQTYRSRKAILKFPREIPLTPQHSNWQLLSELENNLKNWQVPVLIVWGMKDIALGFSFAERFAQMFPNTKKIAKLEDAGHFLQEDCPEEITEEIEMFIAKTSEEQLKMAGHL